MKKLLIIFLIGISCLSFANFVRAQENPVEVHFFYGETCPHCKKAELFLDTLREKYPALEIKSYEVFGSKKNAELFLDLLENCGKEKKIRVPALFIGNEVVIGFLNQETSGVVIEDMIKICTETECIDPLDKLKNKQNGVCPAEKEEKDQIISLPLVGQINLSNLSLPLLTIVLAGIDGFNPCAMWVLLFLLALLINLRSREKMWLIGGTFILASGIVYYLLLTAWLNIFLAVSYVSIVRTVIGILAIIFGVLQIKKFTTIKPGVCPVSETSSIEVSFKERVEKIVASPTFLASFFGIILLAVGVNFIEFFCSAGLPAIYTHTLSLSQISKIAYYLYLLLYTFIFMLDDLIVFVLAVITLDKLGFTDKYSRWSTLIGGIIILLLGLILVLKPELLIFG